MVEPNKPPTLDYAQPRKWGRADRQRTNYCIGLPVIGLGLGLALGRGEDALFSGLIIAAGAFFLALALPVQE